MYSINPCIKFLDEIQNDGSVSMTTLTSRRRKWRSLSTKKLKKTRKNLKKMSKLDVYFKYLNFIHKFKFFGPPMYQEMGRVQWCLKISILSDIFQQLKHRCSQCRHTEAGALDHWRRKYDIVSPPSSSIYIWILIRVEPTRLKIQTSKWTIFKIDYGRISIWGVKRYLSPSMGFCLPSWVNKCHGLN